MIAALTPFLLMLGPVALLVAMGIVFAETGLLVGFFFPGDSLLFTLGVLAAGGLLHLPLWVVALGVALAAVAGDQVGYLLGRRFGPWIYNRPESRWFSRSHAERAQSFFAKHGPKAVVLARFVPVVRTFTPVVAGVARMPRGRFTAYNVLGGLAWTLGLLGVGFYLGGISLIAAHVELFAIGMVALSLVPAAVGLIRHRSTRSAPTEVAQEPAAPRVSV
ncbi:DedA family protein [Nocardioides zhouii]|uniref:DedA family protein n=1 Tax=Nocardioides zhouii TaxID=1168729 RepID=A0A4Q2T6H5_9ACTN|nr:VTT domain-containing protein [Nocardioides zhouii]RYC14322.1 DedA family protein [Nocardioides zhouii]